MVTAPSIPRSTTWETLRSSRNEAAVLTLLTGLGSQVAEIRHRSLKALLLRPESGARKAIVLSWYDYDDRDLELLREESVDLHGACTELLSNGTLSEKRVALEVVLNLDVFDSLDLVFDIVNDKRHALQCQAAEGVTKMCARWGEIARQNPAAIRGVRTKLLDKLYSQIVLFHEHENLQIIDAWLSLAHWEDSAQRGLISDPRLDAYRHVMKRMQESDQRAVLQLLAGYVGRAATPKRILEIVVARKDPQLALEIAKLANHKTEKTILKHLKTMPPLACLETIEEEIAACDFPIERRLWLISAASSRDLEMVLTGAVKLSRMGTSNGRRAAAEVIQNCRNFNLDSIVPALQEASVGTPNERSLGGLLLEVSKWFDSSSTALQGAAEWMFREFTLANLLERVNQWPTQMCKAMAQIVKLSEPEVAGTLSRQLQSPAPKRRLAALQVIHLLGCAGQVRDSLIPLLEDSRLEVRVRVIDLLSALGFEPLEHLLPQLLDDASTDIQEAAKRAVRRFQKMQAEQ